MHSIFSMLYTGKFIGLCKLDRTISRMCEHVGIHGFKTSHSLFTTNATWFHRAGVDEQLITGHRSWEGVRSYKRTSSAQRELDAVLHTEYQGQLGISKLLFLHTHHKSNAINSSLSALPVHAPSRESTHYAILIHIYHTEYAATTKSSYFSNYLVQFESTECLQANSDLQFMFLSIAINKLTSNLVNYVIS